MKNQIYVIEGYHDMMKLENLPDNLPGWPCPGWVIYNTARPLWGHIEWTGDFLQGCFYAAIELDKPDTEAMIKRCKELDGHPLVYVSRETVEIYRVWIAQAFNIETEHYDYHTVVQSLLNALKEGSYTLEDENDTRGV